MARSVNYNASPTPAEDHSDAPFKVGDCAVQNTGPCLRAAVLWKDRP